MLRTNWTAPHLGTILLGTRREVVCSCPWHFDVQVTRPKGDRGRPSPASTGGIWRLAPYGPGSLERQICSWKTDIFSTIPIRGKKEGKMEDEKGKKETYQDPEGFFSRSRHDP